MIVWGGFNTSSGFLNTGGQYDPVANTWTATATAGAPSVRELHTAVWTGSKMIVWGGYGGVLLNDGGQYDPVANTWTATTTAGAPSGREYHTAVWTGSKMIVWGGFAGGMLYLNDGGQYDPVANTWTATTATGAPSGREYHTAVWTGSKMIVWGGFAGFPLNTLNDGGQYDPGTNTWTATTTTSAPSERQYHAAVWTGSRMIVWGGYGEISPYYLNDGGQYDPVANTWTATTTTGAPTVRYLHTAVWTGSRMIVWGGLNGSTYLNDGGQWRTVSLYRKN
jgi:N-acetylneuraminic acid mutarotase